jgi:hypothetical protein
LQTPLTFGQLEPDGLPTGPYCLSTAGGDIYIGNGDSSKRVMVRANLLMQGGRAVQTENANLPFVIDATVKAKAYTTANLPAAATAGAQAYNATLGKPVWSNGTAWTDATGTAI